MKPASFSKQNGISIQGGTHGEVPEYYRNEIHITLWRGSLVDRIRFLFAGRMWVLMHSKITLPPLTVETKSPFKGA